MLLNGPADANNVPPIRSPLGNIDWLAAPNIQPVRLGIQGNGQNRGKPDKSESAANNHIRRRSFSFGVTLLRRHVLGGFVNDFGDLEKLHLWRIAMNRS